MKEQHREFTGGVKRSERLPRYELIDPAFLAEVAEVMAAGAIKYGELNWQKGEQDFVQDIPRHMLMHVFGIMSGDASENHLANLICNGIMMAKLRKKYPYRVPGAPEQRNICTEYELNYVDVGEVTGECPVCNLDVRKIRTMHDKCWPKQEPKKEQPPQETDATKILGQCYICRLDVTEDQQYVLRKNNHGPVLYKHTNTCPRKKDIDNAKTK